MDKIEKLTTYLVKREPDYTITVIDAFLAEVQNIGVYSAWVYMISLDERRNVTHNVLKEDFPNTLKVGDKFLYVEYYRVSPAGQKQRIFEFIYDYKECMI